MLISRSTKKVVLHLSDPARVTNVIPTAKKFQYKGHDLVAVPHRLDEVKVLRNLGIPAPSPIKYHYAWAGGRNPFFAQLETTEFLTLNPRAFVLNDMGCVDSETEYLSPTGWQKISEYSGGQVAQYHSATREIEFVEPTEYVKLPCPTMVHLKTRYGLDQMLSPEHRVLLERAGSGEQEVLQACELLERHDRWVEGGRSSKRRGEIGWAKAAIPVTFKCGGGPGLSLSDAELRLQVAVIADGHFANGTSRCVVRLKRPRKIARLQQLLLSAAVEFNQRSCSSAGGFEVFTFDAPWRVKEFDAQFWSSTSRQLEVVADEVMHWDGSISSDKPSARFSTLSRASADFVQYAFSATGRTARVMQARRRGKTEYTVQVRANGKPLMVCSLSSAGERRPVMSVVPSTDGYKYCFMVPSTFLLFRRNGCVFASGNTGKTLSALWAFDYLRSIGEAKRMLVISPLSTLERTWADEIFDNFPHLTAAVLHGTKERRLKLLDLDADVYIINHDGIKVIEEALLKRDDIDIVVVDELASFRNASTHRWKSLNKICRTRKRLWGMTGTPTPQSPTDAWAQCRLISPERVPSYAGKFRDMVMRQLGPYKWVPRENATEAVAEAMQPAVRFTRDQCIDLPECMYVTREVPLSTDQGKAYKAMMRQLKVDHDAGQIVAVNEAVKLSKLLQICCGVAYSPEGAEVPLDASERIETVAEVIEQAAGKTLVFVPFTSALNTVASQLGERWKVGVVNGATPKGERDRIFHEFQKGSGIDVIVANPGTLSHGLTLTAANTIVWYGPPSSNEQYEQANARITRPGQTRSQLIVHIEGSDVERRVYKRLQERRSMQGALLEILAT